MTLSYITYPHYPWGDVSKCLRTPAREPVTDQRKDPTTGHLGEPVSFTVGIFTEVWVRGYLQDWK